MDELPEVVLTTTTSVDGRISLGSRQRLLDPKVAARWAKIGAPGAFTDRHDALDTTVILEGSGSFVDVDSPVPKWPAPVRPESDLRRDHLPTQSRRWFVVADGRGRMAWQFASDNGMHLHVLVCESTPAGYLQHLRDLGVGYFVVGRERVDLRAGLERIRDVFGAKRVVADSGGTMNASLLREGLVDVVDVITLPGLVGGAGAPTMMDGPELRRDEDPIELELIDVVVEHGAVRSRYRVRGRPTA